ALERLMEFYESSHHILPSLSPTTTTSIGTAASVADLELSGKEGNASEHNGTLTSVPIEGNESVHPEHAHHSHSGQAPSSMMLGDEMGGMTMNVGPESENFGMHVGTEPFGNMNMNLSMELEDRAIMQA